MSKDLPKQIWFMSISIGNRVGPKKHRKKHTWVFPKIGIPPKHPKMIIFSRKTMVIGYHHFRKHPHGSSGLVHRF